MTLSELIEYLNKYMAKYGDIGLVVIAEEDRAYPDFFDYDPESNQVLLHLEVYGD